MHSHFYESHYLTLALAIYAKSKTLLLRAFLKLLPVSFLASTPMCSETSSQMVKKRCLLYLVCGFIVMLMFTSPLAFSNTLCGNAGYITPNGKTAWGYCSYSVYGESFIPTLSIACINVNWCGTEPYRPIYKWGLATKDEYRYELAPNTISLEKDVGTRTSNKTHYGHEKLVLVDKNATCPYAESAYTQLRDYLYDNVELVLDAPDKKVCSWTGLSNGGAIITWGIVDNAGEKFLSAGSFYRQPSITVPSNKLGAIGSPSNRKASRAKVVEPLALPPRCPVTPITPTIPSVNDCRAHRLIRIDLCPNQVCHVAIGGSDIWGNGSVSSPFATIQHSIDIAKPGYTVLVAPGTYVENVNFMGKNVSVKSKEGAATTIIDGNKNGTVVMFVNSENANAILDGFTITNGTGTLEAVKGDPPGRIYGGGIWAYNNSSPTLKNLIITDNYAHQGGGIGLWDGSSPYMENLLIKNNRAIWAAALGTWFDANPTVVNTTIADNHQGGAMWVHDSHPVLINSIVWDNAYGSRPQTQIWMYAGNSTVTVENSIIRNGKNAILVQAGSIKWLSGNLTANPSFMGNGNYQLNINSPAINKGKLSNAPIVDITGNPRDRFPDIGAYEFVQCEGYATYSFATGIFHMPKMDVILPPNRLIGTLDVKLVQGNDQLLHVQHVYEVITKNPSPSALPTCHAQYDANSETITVPNVAISLSSNNNSSMPYSCILERFGSANKFELKACTPSR